MKKLIVIGLIFVLIISINIIPAYAETEEPTKINTELMEMTALIKSMDMVSDCEIISYGDNVLIAVKTAGVFRDSENRKLKNNIVNAIKTNYTQYNNIYVLSRVRDFYIIKDLRTKLQNGADPVEIYNTLIELYPYPPVKPMPIENIPERKIIQEET